MARQAVTQKDLADRTHMTLPALRRRLTGEAPLLVAELLTIAKQLDVPAACLLVDENNAGSRQNGSPRTQPPTARKGTGQ